jgi:hypothetical protein
MDYISQYTNQMAQFIKTKEPQSARDEELYKIEFTRVELSKKRAEITDLLDEISYLEGALSAYVDNLSEG